jgi:hypothetical protein
MLRFKANDLVPVLQEALANRCEILFVKDHGVYIFSDKCERDGENPRHIAYAVGCNPNTDEFDNWWALAHSELGGDDFGEQFNPNDGVFQAVLRLNYDLTITATSTELTLEASKPEG